MKLFIFEGSLKYETDCAPNNGYYFIPVYETGDYILKVGQQVKIPIFSHCYISIDHPVKVNVINITEHIFYETLCEVIVFINIFFSFNQ